VSCTVSICPLLDLIFRNLDKKNEKAKVFAKKVKKSEKVLIKVNKV
jgi:hypothetical protein